MSERGSFVTEFIYCEKCFAAAKTVLIDQQKYLCSQVILAPGGKEHPIIAGKVGGLYGCEELHDFEGYSVELGALICHPLRIAVLAEAGQQIFTIEPAK